MDKVVISKEVWSKVSPEHWLEIALNATHDPYYDEFIIFSDADRQVVPP